MLTLGLSRGRDFTAAQVAAFAISGSFFALYLYMTLYLQDVLHLPALAAGLVYLPGTFLLFVVSGASAKLSEHVAPAALSGSGLVLVAAGLALVTLVGPRSSWTAILPGMLVVCVGTGLFNPALATLALGAAIAAAGAIATLALMGIRHRQPTTSSLAANAAVQTA